MKLIYSHGGYAREFVRCIKTQYPDEEVLFVDDNPAEDVLSYTEAFKLQKNNSVSFIIGFADPVLRKIKTEQVVADGFPLACVQALTSIIGDNVSIDDGSILSDFVMITADAQIGKSFHCNIYSYVAHDCIIGNYVTLAPRVSVNGRVELGDNVYIGTGAIVLPGKENRPLRIGDGATVGAHSLVTKDVPAGTTVTGIPARPVGG